MESNNNGHDHTISGTLDLKKRIMELKSKKFEQEEEIKRDFQELKYSLTPASIIKESIAGSVAQVSEDHDLTHDLVERTLNVGMSYLIGKMFGRSNSIKGYVTSVVAEQIAEYIVKNNTDKIIAGIGYLVKSAGKKESVTEDPEIYIR